MRKRIDPEDRIEVRMTPRDRELLLEHVVVDPEYVERLDQTAGSSTFIGRYTLDDLEDILGYIAAEANHMEDSKLQKELDALWDKLHRIQRSYDDGNWADSAAYDR